MTHPAGFVPDRLWFGPEVEGRLARTRTPTAFIAAPLTTYERDQLVEALVAGAVKHVFLTEGFEDWAWFAAELLPSLHCEPITVARNASKRALKAVLALPFASRLTIVARVWGAPWAKLLRPRDEVSIGQHYDLVTYPCSAGVATSPEDYKGDRS